jgi:ABC-type nitrate/sulfonate/bicarbonate transport system substrate-binding protein
MKIALNRRSFLSASAAAATLPLMPRMAHAATSFAMQAAWINDAEFAGYFIAMDQGYYTAEGLDLTFRAGRTSFPRPPSWPGVLTLL